MALEMSLLQATDSMKSIGIYYHPSFSRKSYMTVGNRLRDFPEALEPLLARPNVRLIESPRVSEDLVLKVHAPEMLTMVAQDGFCSTAYESVGGVVAGMADLATGEVDRAFCFIGAGGHHAGLPPVLGGLLLQRRGHRPDPHPGNQPLAPLCHRGHRRPPRRRHPPAGAGRPRGLSPVLLRPQLHQRRRHQGGCQRLPA